MEVCSDESHAQHGEMWCAVNADEEAQTTVGNLSRRMRATMGELDASPKPAVEARKRCLARSAAGAWYGPSLIRNSQSVRKLVRCPGRQAAAGLKASLSSLSAPPLSLKRMPPLWDRHDWHRP